jgi:exoribonuclease R
LIVHRQLFASLEAERLQHAAAPVHVDGPESIAAAAADEDEAFKQVAAIAAACNAQRVNARKAQDGSSRIFLCLFLRAQPMCVRGVVFGLGSGSCTIGVLALGFEQRGLRVSDSAGVRRYTYKEGNSSDSASFASDPTLELAWSCGGFQVLRMLQPVWVRLTASKSGPTDVVMELCSPAACRAAEADEARRAIGAAASATARASGVQADSVGMATAVVGAGANDLIDD